MAKQFGEKLEQAFQVYGQLCVGIDPHEGILDAWNLEFNASGLAEFSSRVLEACAGRVGIIKPQVSFFERFGSAGFAVLETVIREARYQGILVIADAKRGDIGTTMDAYLGAWLQPGSPLETDALTVSPFLGAQTYLAGMNDYLPKGKGVVSLVSTSNPEGQTLQNAKVADVTLSKQLWNELSQANQVTAAAGSRFGSFCAVIGATRPIAHLHLSESGGVKTPILAPGFGSQGASLSETRMIFGEFSSQVIASVSRSIVSDGPASLITNIESAKTELVTGLK